MLDGWWTKAELQNLMKAFYKTETAWNFALTGSFALAVQMPGFWRNPNDIDFICTTKRTPEDVRSLWQEAVGALEKCGYETMKTRRTHLEQAVVVINRSAEQNVRLDLNVYASPGRSTRTVPGFGDARFIDPLDIYVDKIFGLFNHSAWVGDQAGKRLENYLGDLVSIRKNARPTPAEGFQSQMAPKVAKKLAENFGARSIRGYLHYLGNAPQEGFLAILDRLSSDRVLNRQVLGDIAFAFAFVTRQLAHRTA